MSEASRVVLVTGASSGIGEAVARRAAARGDHVVLLARGREALERVAADCDALGAASTLVTPADVSDDAQLGAAVASGLAALIFFQAAVADAAAPGSGPTPRGSTAGSGGARPPATGHSAPEHPATDIRSGPGR